MKIALVTTAFLPRTGGAEQVVHQLATAWCRAGHQVEVYCDRGAPPPQNLGYPVRTYPLLKGAFRFGPHRFPFRQYQSAMVGRLLEAYRPDFISVHFGYPTAVWVDSLPRMRAAALVTCHGKDLTDAPGGYRRRYGCDRLLAATLSSFPGVIAISSHARRQLLSFGVDPEKVHFISNGVDVARFQKRPPISLRERWQIAGDTLLVLSVGRNTPEKAYGDAISAVGRAWQSNPGLCHLIVGPGAEHLSSQADSRGGHRTICCPGLYGEELVAAYHEADIYFSSSVSELCPLTVLEAMAAGLPLVLTGISGHEDVVQDGENGYLIPAGDAEAAAAALLRLAADRGLRDRMGAANRRKSDGYSWARISRQYLELAEQVIPGLVADSRKGMS